MKKILLTFSVIMSSLAFANDEILGYWYNAKNKNDYKAIIKIEKNSKNEYYGIIASLKEPKYLDGEYKGMEKMDLNNKDKSKQNRKLVGIKIIENFKYSEKDNDYRDGTIYNPEDGKVYYSYIKFKEDGTLYVRGYVDPLGWIGKTNTWSKVK